MRTSVLHKATKIIEGALEVLLRGARNVRVMSVHQATHAPWRPHAYDCVISTPVAYCGRFHARAA